MSLFSIIKKAERQFLSQLSLVKMPRKRGTKYLGSNFIKPSLLPSRFPRKTLQSLRSLQIVKRKSKLKLCNSYWKELIVRRTWHGVSSSRRLASSTLRETRKERSKISQEWKPWSTSSPSDGNACLLAALLLIGAVAFLASSSQSYSSEDSLPL